MPDTKYRAYHTLVAICIFSWIAWIPAIPLINWLEIVAKDDVPMAILLGVIAINAVCLLAMLFVPNDPACEQGYEYSGSDDNSYYPPLDGSN